MLQLLGLASKKLGLFLPDLFFFCDSVLVFKGQFNFFVQLSDFIKVLVSVQNVVVEVSKLVFDQVVYFDVFSALAFVAVHHFLHF